MPEYGFVKILAGPNKGRIGRFIKMNNLNNKAIVSFCYQIDTINSTNYIEVTLTKITNYFTTQDLFDRYFILTKELEKINLRAHETIKKYGEEHNNFIMEFTLITTLINEQYNINNLESIKKEENVVIFTSFKDMLWTNEFILDLESRKLNIGVLNHENLNLKYLSKIIEKSNNYIFILSKNTVKEKWLQEEYQYLIENINIKEKSLFCLRIDDSKVPSYISSSIDLFETYSDTYNENIETIINKIII